MDDIFKLPHSSYEELAKIIKAYGHLGQEVGLEEVSRLTSLHTTLISRNVGFLLAIGLLTPGAKKAATELCKQLARAMDHEMPDEIRKSWRIVVIESDFLNKTIASIRIRNGMDQQTLESHIAYSAGQPKKASVMTGARTVIEILRAAELIHESEGKYIAYSSQQPEAQPFNQTTLPIDQNLSDDIPAAIKINRKAEIQSTSGNLSINLSINVNIACTPDEIDDLGLKLNKIVDGIYKKNNEITGA